MLSFLSQTNQDHMARCGTIFNGLIIPHQSSSRNVPQTCSQENLIGTVLQSRFLLPSYVHLTIKNSHHNHKAIYWNSIFRLKRKKIDTSKLNLNSSNKKNPIKSNFIASKEHTSTLEIDNKI